MTDELDVDICVIGAGSGGLSVAAGASQMGARTVLIEKDRMGGDCLNTGCVPSKSLIAAAAAAAAVRGAGTFGVRAELAGIDAAALRAHVRDVIATIEPNDSQERFEGLGVTVIRETARFVDNRTVEAGRRRIRARRFVLATGSAPFVPPIPGLDAVAYHTNETVFEADGFPEHLVVVGGGPIGCELAQAHRRLGAEVTLVEMDRLLPKDDPELVDVVRQSLIADGVEVIEGAGVTGVEAAGAGVRVTVEGSGGTSRRIKASDILVAAGRRPTIDGLNLEAAGVAYSAKGIEVDHGLRTTNRRIYAIGDCVGGLQFTHVASHHAGVVLRNALFRLPARADKAVVPWVTYTAPELAQVGLTEAEARRRHGTVTLLRWPFHENDRAQAERDTRGFIKVVMGRRGRILGCGIVGPHAGELIHLWVLAMSKGLKIGAIAGMVAPYPTLGEVSKRAAGSYYTSALFGKRTKRIVRFLRLFG